MARSAAQKATEAADRLLDWLGSQPTMAGAGGAGQGRLETAERAVPATPLPEPSGTGDDAAALLAVSSNHGLAGTCAPLRPAHTDWLHHRLVVAGAAEQVAAFRAAAAGAGTVPWRLDLDETEEGLVLAWCTDRAVVLRCRVR